MHAVEEERRLPFMVLAVPTARLARDLGRPIEQLDHHRAGAVFVALGENRSMGGLNASSLNEGFLVTRPTLTADGDPVVNRGVLSL